MSKIIVTYQICGFEKCTFIWQCKLCFDKNRLKSPRNNLKQQNNRIDGRYTRAREQSR